MNMGLEEAMLPNPSKVRDKLWELFRKWCYDLFIFKAYSSVYLIAAMLFVRYFTCTFLTGPIHSGLYATRISYQHYIEHLFSFYCQIFRLEQLQQLVRYLEAVIFFFWFWADVRGYKIPDHFALVKRIENPINKVCFNCYAVVCW